MDDNPEIPLESPPLSQQASVPQASEPKASEPKISGPKDLDYRVKGLKLEYTGNDVLLFLERKLGLEPHVVKRIKSLSISHSGESKVAVISLKPRPKSLSAPGKDEWIFGPTSDDDDTHITVDTHFRGVTVLYAPQDTHHTIEYVVLSQNVELNTKNSCQMIVYAPLQVLVVMPGALSSIKDSPSRPSCGFWMSFRRDFQQHV